MVCAPLLAAAVVAAVAVACSPGYGAYAAAEQEAAGAGGSDLRLRQPPITRGLSFDFYKRSCPRAESIVRDFVRDAVRKDVGLAAGLLRLHFHDCFVQSYHSPDLDATDLVALSGAHTVGLGHCASFEGRLFPRPDPTMSPDFLGRLRRTCPAKGTDARTVLDVRTPDVFDNKYYVNLVNREGLLVSDQDLFTNDATRPIVERFARSQRYFFHQFGVSMVKMGQIRVLTGGQGQVRRNCSARNPGTTDDGLEWSSLVQTVVDAAAESYSTS
uniref:peroxidase n=1 Tax=Aegilops tauschii TaxID=37682 RepID=M8AT29_AEGTA